MIADKQNITDEKAITKLYSSKLYEAVAKLFSDYGVFD